MTVSPAARVLVTRSAGQGSALAEHLRALGADPILIPALEIVDPTSFATLDQALTQLENFHWLLFTSANAVEAFARRLQHSVPAAEAPLQPSVPPTEAPPQHPVISTGAQSAEWRDLRFPPQPSRVPHLRDSLTVAKVGDPVRLPGKKVPRIAAIGPATASALEKLGLTPDLIPPQAVAESLTDALLPHARQPDGTPTRFLLIRAEEAREHLPDTLRAASADITVAPAYRTVIPETSVALLRDLFGAGEPGVPKNRVPHSFAASPRKGGLLSSEAAHNSVNAITFTSSSTARNLVALCEAAGVTLPSSALRISIGPITSGTLRELGLAPHAEALEATVLSLARTTLAALRQKSS